MGQDIYKRVVVMEFPNMIARIHIPDLTEDEQKKRMKRVHDAAVNLLLSKDE